MPHKRLTRDRYRFSTRLHREETVPVPLFAAKTAERRHTPFRDEAGTPPTPPPFLPLGREADTSPRLTHSPSYSTSSKISVQRNICTFVAPYGSTRCRTQRVTSI
ncbi:hypothetical protein EVA_02033 [gut metagenome]|uniref:Uncharacterized protein n=1 Tax=gut metagenome TaxID=749906 RepID=J9H215_9ZZZZ